MEEAPSPAAFGAVIIGESGSVFVGIALRKFGKNCGIDGCLNGTILLVNPRLRTSVDKVIRMRGLDQTFFEDALCPQAREFIRDRQGSGSRVPTVYLAPCRAPADFEGTALECIREEVKLLFLADRSFSHPRNQTKEVTRPKRLPDQRGYLGLCCPWMA